MRLIDADALMKEFAEFVKDSNNSDFADVPMWNDAVSLVASAPTVEVVRCKDCKHKQHCRKAVEHITHEPTSVTIGYKSIEFCSYGERGGND